MDRASRHAHARVLGLIGLLIVGLIALACRGDDRSRSSVSVSEGEVSTRQPAGSSAAPLPHATDFLTAGCPTLVYAGLDADRREQCRRAIASRGYTHFYLYAYNESDFGGPKFDYYRNPRRFREHLLDLRAAGLEPVVWLVPDDAPTIAGLRVAALRVMFDRLVPIIDDLASSYVLGLELDEYWPPQTVNALGTRLSQLTAKPVGVHQTSGRWDYCTFDWCDYMVLQYGFDVGVDEIDRVTRAAIAELGKPVVAGEYELENEGRAVVRGNRGIAAGAAGFGNGGTPGSEVRSRPDSSATDSGTAGRYR